MAIYWAMAAAGFISSCLAAMAMVWQGDFSTFAWNMAMILGFNFLPFLFYSLIALLLWFAAAPLTRLLMPAPTEKNQSNKITLQEAQSIAFAAVGVLVLSSVLPDIGGAFYQAFAATDLYPPTPYRVQAIALSLRLLLGILLLFGSRGFSGWLLRLRSTESKQPLQ